MKRFGTFRTMDHIVSQENINSLHLVVNSISELDENWPEQTVAVLRQADGEFKRGDVLLKIDGKWTRYESTKTAIGPVRNLRGWKLGDKVFLRWSEPRPTVDTLGHVLSDWHHTIIVRKYGSAPQNEYDGTIVYTNFVRNRYSTPDKECFWDRVPEADNKAHWFYRVFAVARDGYVDYKSEALEILDMTWENVINMVREGHADQIFTPGDVIRPNPDNDFELVVASLDTVDPTDKNVKHTVTFMFRYSAGQYQFDLPKGLYQLTKDTVVTDPNKEYFYKDRNGDYVRVYLAINQKIKAEYYYEATNATRAEYGTNRWKDSDIRYWANTTTSPYLIQVSNWISSQPGESKPVPPYVFLRNISPELASYIIKTQVKTGRPAVDGNTTDSTSDLFFLPSVTEVAGVANGSFIEGTKFKIYDDEEESALNLEKISEGNRDIFIRTGWWLRSAYQVKKGETAGNDATTHVHCVSRNGDTGTVYRRANETDGVILAFTIG